MGILWGLYYEGGEYILIVRTEWARTMLAEIEETTWGVELLESSRLRPCSGKPRLSGRVTDLTGYSGTYGGRSGLMRIRKRPEAGRRFLPEVVSSSMFE